MAALSLLLLGFSGNLLAEPDNGAVAAQETRSSISLHTVRGGRDNPGDVRETVEDHKALVTQGSRSKAENEGRAVETAIRGGRCQKPEFRFLVLRRRRCPFQ